MQSKIQSRAPIPVTYAGLDQLPPAHRKSLRAQVRRLLPLLPRGILELRVELLTQESDAEPRLLAAMTTDLHYRRATLQVQSATLLMPEVESILLHEVLHCYTAPLVGLARRLLAESNAGSDPGSTTDTDSTAKAWLTEIIETMTQELMHLCRHLAGTRSTGGHVP